MWGGRQKTRLSWIIMEVLFQMMCGTNQTGVTDGKNLGGHLITQLTAQQMVLESVHAPCTLRRSKDTIGYKQKSVFKKFHTGPIKVKNKNHTCRKSTHTHAHTLIPYAVNV